MRAGAWMDSIRTPAGVDGLTASLTRSSRVRPIDRRSERQHPGEAPGIHVDVGTGHEPSADAELDVDGSDARTVGPAVREPGNRNAPTPG